MKKILSIYELTKEERKEIEETKLIIRELLTHPEIDSISAHQEKIRRINSFRKIVPDTDRIVMYHVAIGSTIGHKRNRMDFYYFDLHEEYSIRHLIKEWYRDHLPK